MSAAPNSRPDFRSVEVVAPNLNRRYSGVTATVMALLPEQAKTLNIASLGHHIPDGLPRVSWFDILTKGWRHPKRKPFRIWHARRNIEMLPGIFLRDVLRQPWKLVFTSAAQRDHSAYTKFLISRMDAVIATSPQAQSYLEVSSTVIMHGVDLTRFRPSDDRHAAWNRTALPGRYGVGAFGRIRHQKGTDLFAEAMIRLLPNYPDFTAVVIGLTTPDNQSFVDAIKARIAAADLSGRFVFLGELPSEEVPGWFARLLIHVAPQRWEGFGLTPLESQAAGTAVVATRAGVFETLIEDGRTGLIVDIEDLDALTGALERLMADPALAEAMGRSGRERASTRFSISGEAAAINDVYDIQWTIGRAG
ncbi:LPS biosynthesis protein [Terrihabitans soli]|uniref:LPS biosynthesis protein n=1 Tax=Terrihabitans soli TaxID=708113 RepID=A0A6S6QJI2_9HYPH|nr:glycosyltransferase family 4 protein [Terrihabitans soli]BCJ91443.1 LPS biosynthesis protein [Terrihabitans soli]